MHGRAVGGLVAAALLTAACGTATGTGSGLGSAGDGQAPVGRPGSAHCPISLPEGSVPAGFATAWVLRCSEAVRPVSGNGRWWFDVEERTDSGLGPLLAALRRPDEAMPPGTVCSGIGVGETPVALVDAAGRVVHPRMPRNSCGHPQQQVLDALAALRFRETRATPRQQEQSQQSVDTRCGQMWIDLGADVFARSKPIASRRMWPKTPDAVRICLWQPQGSGPPRLVRAGTVTGADLARLVARLDQLSAAAACTVPHHRFAVLEEEPHGDLVYAELDGCRRILRPDHTLGELDPTTVELIIRLARPSR
jgi:hypothetical protein